MIQYFCLGFSVFLEVWKQRAISTKPRQVILIASMLETKCVGHNFKMLVSVLAIVDTNIHYLFT